jgi:hypothetical protein
MIPWTHLWNACRIESLVTQNKVCHETGQVHHAYLYMSELNLRQEKQGKLSYGNKDTFGQTGLNHDSAPVKYSIISHLNAGWKVAGKTK